MSATAPFGHIRYTETAQIAQAGTKRAHVFCIHAVKLGQYRLDLGVTYWFAAHVCLLNVLAVDSAHHTHLKGKCNI